MLKLNKSLWLFCFYILICVSLCFLGYLWFSFSSRKMNISSVFRIIYYVIMLPVNLLCIKIFFNTVIQRHSYITVLIFGAFLGTACGFIAWEVATLSIESHREILFNTLRKETLVSYLMVTVPLSTALTLSFLIGAVSAVLGKLLWCKAKHSENKTGEA